MEEEKEIFDIYKAEYSMGQLDYNRYHKLLIAADELAILVMQDDVQAIRQYASLLVQLYVNLKPLIWKHNHKKWEEQRKSIIDLLQHWKKEGGGQQKFPIKLKEELLKFHEDLLEIKQRVGLGVVMEREDSQSERLSKASGLEEVKYRDKE